MEFSVLNDWEVFYEPKEATEVERVLSDYGKETQQYVSDIFRRLLHHAAFLSSI